MYLSNQQALGMYMLSTVNKMLLLLWKEESHKPLVTPAHLHLDFLKHKMVHTVVVLNMLLELQNHLDLQQLWLEAQLQVLFITIVQFTQEWAVL